MAELWTVAVQRYVYFFAREKHRLESVRVVLSELRIAHDRPSDWSLRACPPEAAVAGMVRALQRALGMTGAQQIRVLFPEAGEHPSLCDYGWIDTLDAWTGALDGAWLESMLQERRLLSHFQPIAFAREPRRVFGHEALLRGLDDDGGTVNPFPIFNLARRIRCLPRVDEAARSCALQSAAAQKMRTHLFVNYSPTAIERPVERLRDTVREVNALGLRPEQIVFEITETDSIPDVALLRELLRLHRTYGFKVALDDVGSGYSSLNLVHTLRPDIIKLDMELVRGVHLDRYKSSIASHILSFAKDLRIQTVAEGIECAEELEWVREHGASYVQGYHIARPKPRINDTVWLPALAGDAEAGPTARG